MTRTIPTTFKRVERDFILIERRGDYAIYKGIAEGRSSLWEVHKVQIKEASSYVMGGKEVQVEAGEYLATNSEWGVYGWSPDSYEACLRRILVQNEKDLARAEREQKE